MRGQAAACSSRPALRRPCRGRGALGAPAGGGGVPGGVGVLLLGRDRIPGGSGPARARYGKGRAATAARGWGSQGRGDTGLSLAAGAVRLARRRAASGRRLPTVGGRCGTGLRAKAGFLLVVTAVCQGGGAHRLAAVFWAGLRPRMR